MSFEFTTEVAVRFADFDSYGHANNVAYATYLEEARIDYLETVVGRNDPVNFTETADGTGIVVANLQIDFEAPIHMTDSIVVGVRVPRLGEKSLTFEYEVRSDDSVAATGETTVVTFDRESQSSRSIPDQWREAIAEFEGL